ncbi:tRNA dihydrouridine(20/20a) synthase DusA [Lujinxingia litoralis]|uniref:tRNA-dihydrouridine(20/20a) synthase n=1 Tax=Lujinxingia litoralis TaxID=2211119 RepID=A0A328CBW1_9DELT|nr:tRNA dihydrouridine(20/20a) synthase DusA [Lujinxingia litoralis]RAL25100.1 tRNA dihydrouridine(20/20a) synthase DusA [Lujinxingia litoralis]
MSFKHPISIAPMMKRTDRHFRFLLRLISRRTLLYTEMVTTGAILFGDREQHLRFDAAEHPVSLQLGGDNPEQLAECARIAQDYGYDEVNLNVGCPSDRVQNGNFGACLMKSPETVARAVEAMRQAVDIEVTVKHRIGVDELDDYAHMRRFVDIVADAGCRRFSVHARKAWLQGLSPKENRNVPPLRYPEVWRLKEERPDLDIEINGGILTMDQAAEHLEHVDAVMIGRAAYDNPYQFAEVDQRFYGESAPPLTRHQVARAMFPYIEEHLRQGGKLSHISGHMLQLFAGQPGARQFRRHLSERAWKEGAGVHTLEEALTRVPETSPQNNTTAAS